jgi:hypothetical protein
VDLAYGLILYYGSLVLGLLLLARRKGRRRLLIAGIGVQVLFILLIVWQTHEARLAGYGEWFFVNVFHIPVNILAAVYYLAVAFAPGSGASPK